MADNNNNRRDSSPLSRVNNELQRLLRPTEYNQLFPLINSAVTFGSMSDEEIARQEQERLQFESYMDVDPPPLAAAAATTTTYPSLLESFESDAAIAAATTTYPPILDPFDNDAVIARQLQEEEYSRNSLLPSQSYRNKPSFQNDLTSSDAILAAHLQAEEDRNRRGARSRPVNPPQRSTPSQPEVIPMPFRSRSAQTSQRPSSASATVNDNHRPADHLASFIRNLAAHSRHSPGSRRHGAQRFETRADDFGPNDYEDLLELDKSVDKKPLTDDEINQLPIENFRRRSTQREEDNKCNICWDDFEQNQSLRRLKCLHLYHKDCIDPWLKTSNQCPICRSATN